MIVLPTLSTADALRRLLIFGNVAFYQSTGTSGGLAEDKLRLNTYFPFFGFAEDNSATLFKACALHRPNNDKTYDEKLEKFLQIGLITFDFARRFGCYEALVVSALIGGGFWDTPKGLKVLQKIKKDYPEFYSGQLEPDSIQKKVSPHEEGIQALNQLLLDHKALLISGCTHQQAAECLSNDLKLGHHLNSEKVKKALSDGLKRRSAKYQKLIVVKNLDGKIGNQFQDVEGLQEWQNKRWQELETTFGRNWRNLFSADDLMAHVFKPMQDFLAYKLELSTEQAQKLTDIYEHAEKALQSIETEEAKSRAARSSQEVQNYIKKAEQLSQQYLQSVSFFSVNMRKKSLMIDSAVTNLKSAVEKGIVVTLADAKSYKANKSAKSVDEALSWARKIGMSQAGQVAAEISTLYKTIPAA